MPKLHLKRTPEEEALHRLRKKAKKEAKHERRRNRTYGGTGPSAPPRERSQTATEDPLEPERKWASSDEDEQYGPRPSPSSGCPNHRSQRHKPDQDEDNAQADEMGFRDKLFDAFADDERLDSLEARFNDFAHVPDRWRTYSTSARFNVFEDDEWLKTNPQQMDDEEYAEWIRMGMYRKTHANEYAEQQKRKAADTARRAEEKARKKETARLEKAAEAEREQKRCVRESRRWEYGREAYHSRWQLLLAGNGGADAPEIFGFSDIPWPIVHAYKEQKSSRYRTEAISVSLDDLTLEAISAFLLPAGELAGGEKSRKDVLRETFLRFHPDKFEGRFMKLVRKGEQEAVREGIGKVVRVLNVLMDGRT